MEITMTLVHRFAGNYIFMFVFISLALQKSLSMCTTPAATMEQIADIWKRKRAKKTTSKAKKVLLG